VIDFVYVRFLISLTQTETGDSAKTQN